MQQVAFDEALRELVQVFVRLLQTTSDQRPVDLCLEVFLDPRLYGLPSFFWSHTVFSYGVSHIISNLGSLSAGQVFEQYSKAIVGVEFVQKDQLFKFHPWL